MTMTPSRALFAASMIALGITGLVNADFAMVWQHVPTNLPGRTPLAYACAIFEIVAGAGLLWYRTQRAATGVLFPYMLAWLVLLVVPPIIKAPTSVGDWGTFGEIGSMTAGAWYLFATRNDPSARGSTTGMIAARWLLVLTLPMLGVEVIVDAVAAGTAVMQPWLRALPHPAWWAILTGVGSLATCLALLAGIWPRLAATLEAAMVTLIGVVYWAPVLHTGRTATTAFIITLLVAGGIGLVADSYRRTPWLATGQPVWRIDPAN